MLRRRAVTPVVALVLCGALSACSDHAGSPKPLAPATSPATPSPTATSRTSPSPSVTGPPTMPAEARGTSKASAEAFVRHWVDVLNYSGSAGDSRSLRRLGKRNCQDCDAIADYIDSIGKAHGIILGRGWTLRSTGTPHQESGGGFSVRAVIRVNPQTVVPEPAAVPRHYKGGQRIKTFHLSPSNGSWKLLGLDQGI